MRATFRGIPLTDLDVAQVSSTHEAGVVAGLIATGRRTRSGLAIYREAPDRPERIPLPDDFAGSIQIGGPLPEFWIWLTTTALSLPAAWFAPYWLGSWGVALVAAVVVAVHLVAGHLLSRQSRRGEP